MWPDAPLRPHRSAPRYSNCAREPRRPAAPARWRTHGLPAPRATPAEHGSSPSPSVSIQPGPEVAQRPLWQHRVVVDLLQSGVIARERLRQFLDEERHAVRTARSPPPRAPALRKLGRTARAGPSLRRSVRRAARRGVEALRDAYKSPALARLRELRGLQPRAPVIWHIRAWTLPRVEHRVVHRLLLRQVDVDLHGRIMRALQWRKYRSASRPALRGAPRRGVDPLSSTSSMVTNAACWSSNMRYGLPSFTSETICIKSTSNVALRQPEGLQRGAHPGGCTRGGPRPTRRSGA